MKLKWSGDKESGWLARGERGFSASVFKKGFWWRTVIYFGRGAYGGGGRFCDASPAKRSITDIAKRQ